MARRLAAVPVIGVVAMLALAGPAYAADEKHPDQTSQPPPPSSAAQPSERGHWGIAGGIRRFGGTLTWDYRNSPTPEAGASGPYTGAVVDLDYDWVAPYVSFGYRGPISRGSRVGMGIEGEMAFVAVVSPPNVQTIGTSPTGVQVTFGTTRAIHGLINWAAVARVSYAVARFFNVSGGAAVSTVHIKTGMGGYHGPG